MAISKALNGKPAPIISLGFLDRFVNFVSPARGLARIKSKAQIQHLQNSGIVSGNNSRRSMRGWQTDSASADADLIPGLDTIRARSRDLWANAPIARGALRRARTNVIGPGLILQCQINKDALGLTDEQADDWERDTEARFDAWASNKDCDLTRVNNFYELQGLAYLSMLMSGDLFSLLPRNERLNIDSDLRIALYEADQVSNPQYNMDTDKLAGGIELDRNGAPAKYWFTTKHPGGFMVPGLQWIGVPAFGRLTGRRNVIHLFQRERPNQRRGEPFLSPVVESLKQLTRYSEAELMAAVIQSFFTVFVKQEIKSANPLQQSIDASQRLTDPASTPQDKAMYEMGNGNIIGLDENESVEMADPNRPSSKFDPFFTAVVRQIGAALEIPFEQLILHFTASYSASRGALLEAWKFYRDRRIFMGRNFCDPIYQEWLYEEIIKGRIRAPGFLTDNYKRWAWSRAGWVGPGQGQIDPVKESKGSKIKLDELLSDFETEYTAIHGGNWEAAMRRRKRQEKFLERIGVERQKTTAAGAGAAGSVQLDLFEGQDRTDPLPEE